MAQLDLSIAQTMRQMGHAFLTARAIYVVAELGIADLLADGAQNADELAAATNARPRALYRVLRALAGEGVFHEDADNRFSLTPLSKTLCSDAPNSVREYLIMNHLLTYPAMSDVMHALRNDEPAFVKTFGKPVFDHMEEHPEEYARFQVAMAAGQRAQDPMLAEVYDFSEAHCVVDVGGGNGSLLSVVLALHDHLRGILFDRQTVIEAVRKIGDGRLPSCEFVVGDFFQEVPNDGDIYILKRVIHDWNDEQAITILRNCRRAMKKGGRVLIIETAVGPANEPSWGKLQDLTMLACTNGMERTEQEYADLLENSGLALEKSLPTPSDLNILVAA